MRTSHPARRVADLPTQQRTRPFSLPQPTHIHAGRAVFQLVREQRLLLDRRLAPFDLTMQQGAVLLRIARQGGIRPNEMAADVGTDTSGMTRLIDRLEAKHLVVRRPDPVDRRSLIIELSEAGKNLAPKLGPVFGSVERDLTTGHSTADFEQARAVLKRLLDNMREASR